MCLVIEQISYTNRGRLNSTPATVTVTYGRALTKYSPKTQIHGVISPSLRAPIPVMHPRGHKRLSDNC